MASKKSLPISGTITVTVIVVVLAPPALLDQTAEFKATFLKKCADFKVDKQTCDSKWYMFEKAYVGKKETDVTETSYQELFDKTPFTQPCGKIMLWSGLNGLANRFTKNRDDFFTLADTLLGHVLDGLTWCGKKGSKETFTSGCSTNKPNAVLSFWIMASIKFAQYTCGRVTLMLDGDQDKPYDENRIFGKYELPNLQSPRVKSLKVILVVTKIDGPKCAHNSLKNLSNILKGKKISYSCLALTRKDIEKCIKERKGACW
ncbi:ADP-ribosyl cyclase/cyclic ADP-ribose hydrolase 1-like isoform X1 [Xyrichtys novacula]|uniref:ADP-ribosyl cyclase/cyclic ADP-ribose hydrolase n=1 Tax=Xyrichtys novacula TaxID=13765 RepID=A0AAV1HB96_XYRNO|nr:ADP-ribosyl cyclase/cyclic ADP-ribose hydrolase 1-like isoform X1 [Xyrichtys novacula]